MIKKNNKCIGILLNLLSLLVLFESKTDNEINDETDDKIDDENCDNKNFLIIIYIVSTIALIEFVILVFFIFVLCNKCYYLSIYRVEPENVVETVPLDEFIIRRNEEKV